LTEEQIGIIKPLLEALPLTLNAYLASIGRNGGQNRYETTGQVERPSTEPVDPTNDQ
jgi:hypothetical protein